MKCIFENSQVSLRQIKASFAFGRNSVIQSDPRLLISVTHASFYASFNASQ